MENEASELKKQGVVEVEPQIISRSGARNFRFPSGAVPDDSSVTFEIQVPRSMGLKEVSIVLIEDKTNTYEYTKMNWKGIEEDRDVYEKEMECTEQGLFWYYFELKSLGGASFVGKGPVGALLSDAEPPSWQLSVYDKHFKTPDWIKGGLFYHIFVDRFARDGNIATKENSILRDDWGGLPNYAPDANGEVLNNDFFGGNLKGILSKLDYLQSLGVTCLYVSPIFEAYSNHKYDTGDYMKIDPMFGDEADFRSLCREAKKRGMKVMLDGVFNHTGSDSLYFNKKGSYGSLGAFQSEKSEYYSWYKFLEYPHKYESWWGIDTLPSVNEEDSSFLEFITGTDGVARKWLKEGASGWRLDVVDELPDRFLETFRNAVKDADEQALIIGEVWEDASNKVAYGQRRTYFSGRQLDSVMNYPFMYAIIRFVRYRDAESLNDAIMTITENYPPCVIHCLMNMLGTHDTRRVLTALGGLEMQDASKEVKSQISMGNEEREQAIRLLKMASLIQMTVPGVPCIYYGDEAGMEGYEDPLNRRCYPWGDEDRELIEWYRKIGNIRKDLSLLAEGTYTPLHAANGVFIFSRTDGEEKAVVGINRSEEPFCIEIEKLYKDLLNETEVKGEYAIEADGFCLLKQINK